MNSLKYPPKYEFGYDINDGKGGSQGHIETRDGIYALGKYYVNLPGGSDQKVDYFADDWGYHPLVEYKSSSHTGSSSTQFAFGEKAVAALSKSNPTVPSLDVIKATSPVLVQPKPLVSIKSTLGIVSDPSQYNNEVYSTTTQPTPVDPSGAALVLTQPYPAQYETRNPQPTQSPPESPGFDSAPNYDNFESQRFSSLIQPEVVSSNFVENQPKYAYSSTVPPQYNAPVTNTGYESTTYRPEVTSAKSTDANDIQIVSYLADTNSAIDVTGKGSQSQEGSVKTSPVTHTISAFLVAEEVENKINAGLASISQEIVSTTHAPKTLFKPIVVPDVTVRPTVSDEPPYESSSIVYKDSKFYKTSSRYPLISNAQSYNTDLEESSQRLELPTPTPSLEPVLVTPKPTAKLFTSSDSILAPIQAAVTLSHSESTPDCDDLTSIEQANIQDKEVYTTSIDVQKSIPYEIVSKEQSNYNQNFNISYGNNFNYEGAGYPEVGYQTGGEVKYRPNSFLQQVIQSYQKLSNGDNGGYYHEQERNINVNPSNVVPEQNQQYFVPNRLYYVYLQRFNPYVNRYAQQVGYNQYQTGEGYSEQSEGIQYAPTQSSDVRVLTANPQEQIYQQYASQTDSINNNNYYANQGNVRDEDRQGVGIPQVRPNVNYKNVETGNFEVKSEFVVPSAEFEKSIEKSQTSFAQGQAGNVYGESLQQVVNTADRYQSKEEFANNLANLYATQLNALRSLESEKSENYEKERLLQYDSNSQNVGDYVEENRETSTYTGRENIISNNNANTVTKVEDSAFLNLEQNEKVQFIDEKQDITRKLSPQVILQHAIAPEIHTQIVEKPVPVEVTKIVEKPVPVPHPVPVTKVVHVEKPVAVPYPVTKLVAVDRPVAVPEPYPVPHPVPLPYEVPHPIGVPVPHFIPYPHLVHVPYKEYHPVYIYAKKERLEHLRHSNQNQRTGQRKPFTPSQQVFTSQYPPRTYQISGYFKGPNNRGQGRKLCIEYGGFKPPLIPSVQIDDVKSNSYPSSGKHR